MFIVTKFLQNICVKQNVKHINSLRFNHTDGLKLFLDDPKHYGKKKIKSGRSWTTDDLRLKSNQDLHKLWYVLYKERNMLLTMEEACRQELEVFPSPERIAKVEESMDNLETVVRERNKAYWQLEVSPCASGERKMVFRRDVFGRPKWQVASQHLVPYKFNSKFRLLNSPKPLDETGWFFARYREMKRKHYNYRRAKNARYIRDLIRRFPDLDIDYVAECYPEFPPGYIKHLKENIDQYTEDNWAPYFIRRPLAMAIKDMKEL